MLIVFLWPIAAPAQDLAMAPVGSKISKTAIVYGHHVPLPPGEFELVSRLNIRNHNTTAGGATLGPGGDSHISTVWLMSVVKGTLDAAIMLRANLEPGKVWYLPRTCSEEHYFTSVTGENGRDAECWLVGGRNFDLSGTPSPEYMEFLKRSGDFGRPNVAPYIFCFVVAKGVFIQAEFTFAPRHWKLGDDLRPWQDNSWRGGNARRDPRKARVMQTLTDQGQAMCDGLKAGLSGRDPNFTWKVD